MRRIALDTSLSWGWGGLALLLTAGLFLYYRHRLQALPPRLRHWILGARTFFMAIVLFLLIDPHLTWRRIVEAPPRIGIFLDNSLSMGNHSSSSLSTILAQVSSLYSWAASNDYEPVLATFGESLIVQDLAKMDYKPEERITDFELLQDWWPSANLAAGFIFSDGVATMGPSPSIVRAPAGVPIYTIGVGDTMANVDLTIDVLHYPLSLLSQERGQVVVTVRGKNALGQRRRLFLFHDDELIFSKSILFGSRDYTETVTAPIVGRLDAKRFRVDIEVLPEETNIDNNRREFEIDVLPGRRDITLLTGALSPNTTLWRDVIKDLSQVRPAQLTYLGGRWRGEEQAFWREKQDLVILDNYPTPFLPAGHVDRLLEKLKSDRSAVIVSEGPDSGHGEFVRLLNALGITVVAHRDTVGVEMPIELRSRSGLSLLDRSGLIELAKNNLPPTDVRFYMPPSKNRRFSPIVQRANGGWTVAYGVQNRGKYSAVLLPSMMSLHLKLGRTAGAEILTATLRALVEWSLEPEGFTPFVVQTDRGDYHLGEKVLFRAMQRDRAGDTMLQPVLTLEVEGAQNSSLVSLNYNFESGEYEGDFWPSESGIHRYRVEGVTGSGGAPAWQRFEMRAGRVELEVLSQNRYGLARLANINGGSYITLTEAAELWQKLSYAPRNVAKESRFNLWQLKYLGIVMILLLALEWGLRRRAGLI